MNKKGDRAGQTLLLTVVAIGGSILGATVIAGLLMVFQIRQAADLRDSNKAIFAADAGIEKANYVLQFPNQQLSVSGESLLDVDDKPNGAAIDKIVCYDTLDATTVVDCKSSTSTPVMVIRSYGQAGRANRAFQQ